MAWRSSGLTNEALIENLCNHGMITDDRVKTAFLAVDRAHYTRRRPYDDAPQSIGFNVTISAPHMHALAIKHLMPFVVPDAAAGRPAPRVLDIGSGTGYLTHVLAELVGNASGATVVGVEHVAPLRNRAVASMAKSAEGRRLLETGRVRFYVGDGRLGAPAAESATDAGLFDAIHVGASGVEVHQALLDQLRAPGRIFMPLDDPDDPDDPADSDETHLHAKQYVWTIDKDADGRITRKRLFGVRYVPLTDAPVITDSDDGDRRHVH